MCDFDHTLYNFHTALTSHLHETYLYNELGSVEHADNSVRQVGERAAAGWVDGVGNNAVIKIMAFTRKHLLCAAAEPIVRIDNSS